MDIPHHYWDGVCFFMSKTSVWAGGCVWSGTVLKGDKRTVKASVSLCSLHSLGQEGRENVLLKAPSVIHLTWLRPGCGGTPTPTPRHGKDIIQPFLLWAGAGTFSLVWILLTLAPSGPGHRRLIHLRTGSFTLLLEERLEVDPSLAHPCSAIEGMFPRHVPESLISMDVW